MRVKSTFFLCLCIYCCSCIKSESSTSKTFSDGKEKTLISDFSKTTKGHNENVTAGAARLSVYKKRLEGKKVGLVANQTSIIFKKKDSLKVTSETRPEYIHLVDSLLSLKINLIKVFAPEHGFRGTADAGETVKDGIDKKTGLPLISLYGKNKKPGKAQLEDIEIMLFDIQDVGVRFYTYISTLHYVMEACAQNRIPLIVLDRPNPNGFYIDGPVLEKKYSSFLGMHPVPLVHGMTIGEYAMMINGEGWLENNVLCNLTVVSCEGYDRREPYHLEVRPSPNLPNDKSINLYPSLGLFEGTHINAGRGTNHQFQVFGAPFLDAKKYNYTYTPQPNAGAKKPKHIGELCYGKNLTNTPALNSINLDWLIEAYKNTLHKKEFFNTNSFTLHAGTPLLQQQIEKGLSASAIKKTWQPKLRNFEVIRKKYLLYN